jgi:hypothetical protein
MLHRPMPRARTRSLPLRQTQWGRSAASLATAAEPFSSPRTSKGSRCGAGSAAASSPGSLRRRVRCVSTWRSWEWNRRDLASRPALTNKRRRRSGRSEPRESPGTQRASSGDLPPVRLRSAGCRDGWVGGRGVQRQAAGELKALREDAGTSGSPLNKLLTKTE